MSYEPALSRRAPREDVGTVGDRRAVGQSHGLELRSTRGSSTGPDGLGFRSGFPLQALNSTLNGHFDQSQFMMTDPAHDSRRGSYSQERMFSGQSGFVPTILTPPKVSAYIGLAVIETRSGRTAVIKGLDCERRDVVWIQYDVGGEGAKNITTLTCKDGRLLGEPNPNAIAAAQRSERKQQPQQQSSQPMRSMDKHTNGQAQSGDDDGGDGEEGCKRPPIRGASKSKHNVRWQGEEAWDQDRDYDRWQGDQQDRDYRRDRMQNSDADHGRYADYRGGRGDLSDRGHYHKHEQRKENGWYKEQGWKDDSDWYPQSRHGGGYHGNQGRNGQNYSQVATYTAQKNQSWETTEALVEAAINEAIRQLKDPRNNSRVWIDDWPERFRARLGDLRTFLEKQTDHFLVIPGKGRRYSVALVTKSSGVSDTASTASNPTATS